MAVLAVLLLALAQMFNVTGESIKNNGGHLDVDSQARMIFDRLAGDFAAMPKRNDVDYAFLSQPGNDRFFFYSEAPAILSSGGRLASWPILPTTYWTQPWTTAGWISDHDLLPRALAGR